MRGNHRTISRLIFGLFAAGAAVMSGAIAQPCEPTAERSATVLSSREVAGNRDYNEYMEGPGWTFQLKRAAHGWDVRLLDENGLDLTQMTPPLRGAPNPRELYGWHFRNADNTGPNAGDVNAPQKLRLFGFEPALTGTGGYKPSNTQGVDPENQPGRGALTVRDMGLADLEPGKQARMNYLKFDVCMTWPKTDREKQREAEETARMTELRKVTPELIEFMGSCGLDYELYQITPFLTPVDLGGDFDGDDSHDQAVPIIRKTDGKRGVFMCRALTYGKVLGMSGLMGKHLSADYFDHIDWWSLHPKGEIGQGAGEGPPPQMLGDAITIGKEESSSAIIYWTGTDYTGYWQGD